VVRFDREANARSQVARDAGGRDGSQTGGIGGHHADGLLDAGAAAHPEVSEKTIPFVALRDGPIAGFRRAARLRDFVGQATDGIACNPSPPSRENLMRFLVLQSALGLLCAAALTPAARASDDEYARNMNYPKPLTGTRDSRLAQRKAMQRELADPAVREEILSGDTEWGMSGNAPRQVSGTHASRKAERHEQREEMRELVRSGEMPVTDEFDVNRVRR
jgi:hypothetical protein